MPSSWNECDYIYIASGQLLPQGALCCNQQSDDHDEQALGESGEEKLPLNRGSHPPWPIWDEREEKKERRQKTHYKRQPEFSTITQRVKKRWVKEKQCIMGSPPQWGLFQHNCLAPAEPKNWKTEQKKLSDSNLSKSLTRVRNTQTGKYICDHS